MGGVGLVVGLAGTGIGCLGFLFIAIVLLLTVVLSVVPGGSNILRACAPSPTAQPGVVQATSEADSIPENYLEIYQETGRDQNIPWNVLAGIGKIETNHGRSTLPGVHDGENYAGAGGPMQFIESSWDAYGADGDGDGVIDRYDPEDAILGAANHLRGSIDKTDTSVSLNSDDIARAVHRYNPGNYTVENNPYVDDVLAAVNSYGRSHTEAPANYAGAGCGSQGGDGSSRERSGSFGQRIADNAAYYAIPEDGTPRLQEHFGEKVYYSWGGGDFDGPDKGICCSSGGYDGRDVPGFDCSGLVQHAVYEASNGKIRMYPPSGAMWNGDQGTKVRREQLAPGDLVFFNGASWPGHVGIYYGEFNGKRWMVEAPQTWLAEGVRGYVRFSDIDDRSDYVGALRVTPPAGMGNRSPDPIRAMSPSGAGAGEGAM